MISSKVIFRKISRLRGNKYSKWIPCIKCTAILRSDSGFRSPDPRSTSKMQMWQSGRTSYHYSHLHPIVGWKLRSEFANHLQEGKYISPTACSENGKSHLCQWEPLLATAFSSAEAFESSHCLLNSLDSGARPSFLILGSGKHEQHLSGLVRMGMPGSARLARPASATPFSADSARSIRGFICQTNRADLNGAGNHARSLARGFSSEITTSWFTQVRG